ncbi:MAG: class I SAM-dependent methyltransferase [Candidatus Thiodiazotropha taylori]|nr:class I SAM-dependent methyltransferase [Candidatus Thiodiazotropha taylori]MCG8079978.1 class I SAM-dependent methyltransferase [Candidatus Thiodiazotropha taylori]MCG8107591.1 class I SAM-dependent methyltransferase [Candidatus Thiodiazotropha taylori]MCG8111581.1 class I SAM-dependent methyltransferase [Candidatus Thiodiazotropha taylori]MCG8124260.1 class I SAM-dependent methyltransferase [Candidatus Thiodiazotropha taylori]
MINIKSKGWDELGSLFWSKGRESARPSAHEINLFLSGVKTGNALTIVGASTKDLIEKALDLNVDVTVLDFSEVMCRELKKILHRHCSIFCVDITDRLPDDLWFTSDLVLSDRLFNRFTEFEAKTAIRNMSLLLKNNGAIRTSVKLGYYPMDELMIKEGERSGRLQDFFDSSTDTIDFRAAGDIVEACLLPHGNIPIRKLVQWYRMRGREKRYSDEDMHRIVKEFGSKLMISSQEWFPNAPETMLYQISMQKK